MNKLDSEIVKLEQKLAELRLKRDAQNMQKSPFFMITVTGEFGSKVRHKSYTSAEKEATRLAKMKNHEAYIMGVVAIAKPTVTVSEVEIEKL